MINNTKQFFAFARERERIHIRRGFGNPKPWTDDPVLRDNFFCNVFREHDKTTVWFRKNIRGKVRGYPRKAFLACVAFRWFNHIPSGEIMAPMLLRGEWEPELIRDQLKALPQKVGGAYVVRSPDGMDKVDGLLQCISAVNVDVVPLMANQSLESMHKALLDYHCLGPFMAYEIVTDLRHTMVLRDAPDIYTWASPGPGCSRGLGWVYADDPKEFRYGSRKKEQLELMDCLLASADDPRYWPHIYGRWEMREVEHVLCEYDKYMRGCAGQKLKRKYNGE